MKRKPLILILFALMVLAQLYVPAGMILNREDILRTGKAWKFKTAPVDPNDPFRGKYVHLNFAENVVKVTDPKTWNRGDVVYVHLKTDKARIAKVARISKEKPAGNVEFVKATVDFVNQYQNRNEVTIAYPFNRFYMEESKAPAAETTYNQTQLDTTKTTYALVYLKDGDAVLQDVLIDGESLQELVKNAQKR